MSDDAALSFARPPEEAGIVEIFSGMLIVPAGHFVRRARNVSAHTWIAVSVVLIALLFSVGNFLRFESESADGRTEEPKRAPYEAPSLKEHGSVTDLTRKVGSTAALDGGKGSRARSAP